MKELDQKQEQTLRNFARFLKEAEAIGKTGRMMVVLDFNCGGVRRSELWDVGDVCLGYFNKRD